MAPLRVVGVIRHAMPGRVRLRLTPRDPWTLARVQRRLEAWPHTRRVQSSGATGSLLVHFDGTVDELSSWLEEVLELRTTVDDVSTVVRSLNDVALRADRVVRRHSRGSFDLRTAAFSGVIGIAVVQALRGKLAGPVTSLVGLALSILMLPDPSVALASDEDPGSGPESSE